MAFDPYTAVLVGDEKKKFDPFNATLVEDQPEQTANAPEALAKEQASVAQEPSLESFFKGNRRNLTREEKRQIELAQPGVLGDTTYGHALYGSMKTGLAGLLGKGENGELTPGALRVLEEGRKEDIYPTMENVIDAYNQEGLFSAAQKFGEAAPYTLVRTAPQIAAGVAGAALAPELGIGTALTRMGLAPLATVGEGMIPKAIAAYPTQIPFNYSGNILEQQQAREAQIARGETPTPLSGEKALAGAAAQSVLDSLIAGRFAGASPKLSPAELLAKAGSQETAGQALARVGKSALEAGVENAIAEPAQEAIARAQANEELTGPEATRAYIASALGGAPMAVAGVPKGISETSAPEKARQELSTAAERADEILNPTVGVPSNPLTSEEFKKYGELMAYAKHAQTLGVEGYEKTPEEFHKELESRVGVEPEKLQEMSLQKPSEQIEEVGVEQPTAGKLFSKSELPKLNAPAISNELWNKEVKNNAYADDTRGYVSYISPQDFLKLTPHDVESTEQVQKRAKEHGPFNEEKFNENWLPTLDINKDGKVEDHEGRARAYMAQQAGYDKIPVLMRLPKTNKISDISQAPTSITQQEGNETVAITPHTLAMHGETNPSEQAQPAQPVKAEELPNLNANNQPIAQTPEATKNFWNWFGDSKVVDADGKPLVVYRGMNKSVDTMQANEKGVIYVTPNADYASDPHYGGKMDGVVYPLFVKAENLFDYNNQQHKELLRSVKKPIFRDAASGNFRALEDSEVIKFLKENGFDGYMAVEPEGQASIAVFDPHQIKSAVGNRGTYSPEESSIVKSKAAAPTNAHTKDSLQQALTKRYGNNAPKVNIGTRADVQGDSTVQGFYDPATKSVTLIPENIDQSKDLHGLIRHEVAVHAKRLGKTDAEFQSILKQLNALKNNKAVKEAYAKVPKDTAAENIDEEALGYLVEHAKELPIVKRFMSWLRRMANKLTGSSNWLRADDFAKLADEVLSSKTSTETSARANLAPLYSKVQPSNDNWSAEEVDSLRQKIDKMSDVAKETVLRAPSVAGIYDIATERLLPNGKNIVQQARQMGAEQRHNVTKVADKVKTLHEWLAKDFTKRHILDEVTSEATILGARPDNPGFMHKLRDSIATNKPEGYKETLARLSKLQSDWNRLGKSGQDMYKMMRNHYQTALEDMYEAMKSNVRKLSSLTPDEKAERIRQLDEQLASVKLKGDYFPILRYGNWGVSYKENGETKYSKFETQRQAQDFIKKLESEGSEGYAIKDSDEIRNVLGVDTADFNKLYNDVRSLGEEGAPDIDELKDMLFQAYLMSRPEQSISKRFMHRKGTAGYSNDAIRAFAKHSLSMANQLPRIKYGRQILDSLQSMKHDLPKEGLDNIKSQYFYEAFKREVNNTINPDPTNPIAGFLTQFGFDSYLTSVASALNQMASVPALALPAIGKNPAIGFDGATKALNTATQLYIKSGANKTDGWWNILRGIDKTPDLNKSVKGAKHADEFDPKDAYQQFLDNGVIDSTLYMQAFDAGNKPTGAHEDTLDRAKRIMNVVATPFGQLESASRQIASMGAYIAGMKSGMGHQEAVEYAIDLIYRDMGDFGPTGRSKLARSTLGRIGYQFQQYSTKLLHSITMSVRDIFSDNPQDRKIAVRHLAGLMAVHWVLAGALGLPGVGIVGTAADELEDLMDEDEWHSYEANLKSWLNKKLPDNEFIQNIILEGPLATALGVDLKSRLGAQDILPLFRESEMNDGVVRKTADKLGQMATGIPTVGAISTSLDHYEKGDYGKALMGLFPNAQIKSIAKAYQYSTEGKVTPKGGEVVSPKEITKADVVKRAIGYEPLTVSQKSTAAREQAAENRFLSTRKSKIQEELVESIVKDDKPAQQKAMKLIEKFSNKNPAYAFDSDEISSAIKSRYKYLATNTRGQNIPLKQLDYYLNKVPHLKK